MKLSAKRLVAMGIAVLLCMGTMSIMASAAPSATFSYSMENAMDLFTVTYDATDTDAEDRKTVISVVTDEVQGNTDPKLKIENKEDVTVTLSMMLDVNPASDRELGTTLEVLWDFYLASMEIGEGAVNKGVKLESADTSLAATDYFKDATYTHWRKMMMYKTGNIYDRQMTLTFSGKGTLYLGNLKAQKGNRAINGDLEGVSGDGIIANVGSTGWTVGSGTLGYWREGTEEPTTEGWYVGETSLGNYIMGVGTSRTVTVRYNFPIWEGFYEAGQLCKITVSQKSDKVTNGGIGFTAFRDFREPTVASAKSAHWAWGTAAWSDKSITYLYDPEVHTDNRIGVNMHARLGTTGKVYIDNVRIEKIENEAIQLADATSTEQQNLKNGEKMTVQYTRNPWSVSEDWSTLTDESVSKEKVALLAVLYEKTGENTKVKDITIVSDIAGKAVASTATKWEDNDEADWYDIGLKPITFNHTFDVPEEGDYMLKLFVWNSIGGLKPVTDNEYVFITAPSEAA